MPARGRSWRAGAAFLFLAVGSAACGGATDGTSAPNTTAARPSPTAAASPTSTAPAASALTAPPSPSGAASADVPDRVVVDLSLLDHLPSTVDGLPVDADAETSASIAASPSLASDASAIAIARIVAPGSDDLAIASIVRLRSGPFSDEIYRVWRATYDRAACEPAGGLGATDEQQIGGRQVFVGACNGGAQTYHVALTEDILVSVTAIGPRHLGDLLVAGLRE